MWLATDDESVYAEFWAAVNMTPMALSTRHETPELQETGPTTVGVQELIGNLSGNYLPDTPDKSRLI